MKNIFIWTIMLLFSCSGMVYAQGNLISFNKPEHDFGTIPEDGGKVTCDFIITNNSSESLLISRVTTSCGCTTPKWTKEPIEPGKTGVITAEFNPKGRPGSFSKAISIYNNQTTNPLKLRIKGVVERDPNASEPIKLYPVHLGDLLLKNQSLNFGQMGKGQTKTIHLDLYNNGEISLIPTVGKLPAYLTVKIDPDNIPGHSPGTMRVTLNTSLLNEYGNVKEEFNIIIGDTAYPFTFTALIVDDLSSLSAAEKAEAGKINLAGKAIDLSKSENSATLKISNSGKNNLNIRDIESTDPLVTVSKTQLTIKPEQIGEVKINVARKKMTGSVSSTIVIVSDDPNNQVQRIPVKVAFK